ncbi:MAG: hypothetical protein DWQ01_11870 [Planctomycetota bacterium]|nr:MAG: hypothetical protein DWQ01_11870 [Planctomycetota bacterium]
MNPAEAGAGFCSYRHPQTGEAAHDRRDPLAEAQLSFVEPAAQLRPPRCGEALAILEIGFGWGINTATALRHLDSLQFQGSVQAQGFEPNPEWLEPWPAVPDRLQGWTPWWGGGKNRWQLPGHPWQGEILSLAFPAGLESMPVTGFDWIFLDLFSPRRHPEDWSAELFAALAKVARPGAALTSYCCARRIRQALGEVGWQVQRLRRRGHRDTLQALWR